MIVDLIIIGVVLLFVLIGYIRGLTGSILKIVSFFLAIILATVLFKPVSNIIINSTQIDEKISSSIRGIVIKEEEKTEAKENNTETKDEKTAVPEVIQEYITDTVTQATKNAKEAVADVATQKITEIIVGAGTWIALFIALRLIFLLLKFVLGFLTELPVIKQIDKTGGIVYGFLEGIVVLYLVFAILSLISPMISDSSVIIAIKESTIGNIMYNNNLLIKFIF